MDEIWATEKEVLRSFWQHPARILLCAPSQSGMTVNCRTFVSHISLLYHSGKSHLIGRLIRSEQELWGGFDSISLFKTAPSAQYYQWAADIGDRFVIEDKTPGDALEALISEDRDTYPKSLFILEDFFTQRSVADPRLTELYTAGSGHLNLTVIATSQVLFSKSDLHTVALQSTVIGLWPSFRDSSQFRVLTRQVFPSANPDFLGHAIQLANKSNSTVHKNPLFINVSNTYFSDSLRVASGCLPGDDLVFYRPSTKRHK